MAMAVAVGHQQQAKGNGFILALERSPGFVSFF
jgi:hypothetical protein